MKIEKKVLTEYLKKVQMTGDQQITECVFNFEDSGLKIVANSPSNLTRSAGLLKPNAFKEYAKIDPIGINQLNEFILVIERFDGMIDLKVEGNVLNVKGVGKKVDIELVDTSFITTEMKEPTLEFVDTFSIPAKRITEIFNDVKLNKDSVLTFETIAGKVLISNTGKYKFQHSIDCAACNGGAKSKFGEPLINAIGNLKENLEISIGTNYPIKVMEKTDASVVTIICAPRVDSEE